MAESVNLSARQHRRKKLLINPNFQIRFLTGLLVLNVLVCGIFYLAHAYFFWQGRELGQSINLPADHVFYKFLAEQQRSLNVISLVTMLTISVLIAGFGLVYSHRIAGPIFRLQKYLRERSAGTETGLLSFRQNDYFPEIADSVNEFFDQRSKTAKPEKAA